MHCWTGHSTAVILLWLQIKVGEAEDRVILLLIYKFKLHSNTEKIDSCMQGGAEMTTYKFPQFMIPDRKVDNQTLKVKK